MVVNAESSTVKLKAIGKAVLWAFLCLQSKLAQSGKLFELWCGEFLRKLSQEIIT